MKNKKKLRQKQEEAEARARGELAEESSSSEEEEEEEEEERAAPPPKKKRKAAERVEADDDSEEEIPDNRDRPAPKVDFTGVNAKEKCLILSSRGVTSRYRHLMLDIGTLIPHSKKDSKLDTKTQGMSAIEVADMKSCTSAMFFECRKRTDCYMWLAKCPDGPSVKFHVENAHDGRAQAHREPPQVLPTRSALRRDVRRRRQPSSRPHQGDAVHCFSTPYKHHKMSYSSTTSCRSTGRMAECGSGTTRLCTPRGRRCGGRG